MAESNNNAQKLEDLLHAINHDLRTPLGNIRSATAILLQNLSDPLSEDQRLFIEIIDRSTLRLLDQSNRLLIFSQIAFEPFTVEPVLVSDLLATAKKNLKNHYEIDEVHFVTNGDATLTCHNELLAAVLALLAAGDTKQQTEMQPVAPPIIKAKPHSKTNEFTFTIYSQMPAHEFSHGFNSLVNEIVKLHNGTLTSIVENGRKKFTLTLPRAANTD